jgi:mannose-6-phosphate isomerase class I
MAARPKELPLEVYPLRTKEIFRQTIWGGTELKKELGKKCPARTGESWELSLAPSSATSTTCASRTASPSS